MNSYYENNNIVKQETWCPETSLMLGCLNAYKYALLDLEDFFS